MFPQGNDRQTGQRQLCRLTCGAHALGVSHADEAEGRVRRPRFTNPRDSPDTAVRGPGVVRSAVNVTRDARFMEIGPGSERPAAPRRPRRAGREARPRRRHDRRRARRRLGDRGAGATGVGGAEPVRRGRIAARAASASTRRQYSSIFRAFGDWLCSELGRPPLVADLDTDAIAQPAVDRTLHRALQSLSAAGHKCCRGLKECITVVANLGGDAGSKRAGDHPRGGRAQGA